MELYARQGDLVFNKLSTPVREAEMKPVRGLVLAGTDSSPHSIPGLVLHRQEGRKHFFVVKEPTVSEHAGRHKPVALEAGAYEVYPLRERGDGQDRAVED